MLLPVLARTHLKNGFLISAGTWLSQRRVCNFHLNLALEESANIQNFENCTLALLTTLNFPLFMSDTLTTQLILLHSFLAHKKQTLAKIIEETPVYHYIFASRGVRVAERPASWSWGSSAHAAVYRVPSGWGHCAFSPAQKYTWHIPALHGPKHTHTHIQHIYGRYILKIWMTFLHMSKLLGNIKQSTAGIM